MAKKILGIKNLLWLNKIALHFFNPKQQQQQKTSRPWWMKINFLSKYKKLTFPIKNDQTVSKFNRKFET